MSMLEPIVAEKIKLAQLQKIYDLIGQKNKFRTELAQLL